MNTEEFIQQHAPDGNLTAQQAAELLQLGYKGDTANAENGDAPGATLDDVQKPDVAAGTTDELISDEQMTVDNTVILAKDGKHTIGYDKLLDARNAEKHWRDQAATAQQELAVLREQAQQREAAGLAPTDADQNSAAALAAIESGVNPEIFGDFSEEAMVKGIQALVDQRVSLIEQRLQQTVQPLQAAQQTNAATAHYDAIYAAHPDADSLVESQELKDWITAQVSAAPSFAKAVIEAGFKDVLTKGTAAQVVELFDSFKQATGTTQQPAPVDLRAAAKAAIAKTPIPAPLSLSDIPGGTAVAGSKDEAMAAMNPHELSEAMQRMTPKQIEEYMNRAL